MAKSQLNLVNLFLDIAETKELAEVKSALSALHHGVGAAGKEAADMAPGDAAAKCAELAGAIEGMDLTGNAFRAFCELLDIRRRLSAIEEIGFAQEADRQRYEQALQAWQRKHDRVIAGWNQKAVTSARRLANLLGEAHDLLAVIIAWFTTDSPPELEDLTVTGQIDRLDSLVSEIESLVPFVPGAGPESISTWHLLQEAKAGIIKNHRKNVLLYKCAVMMSRADGEMSPVERDFLLAVSRRIRLTKPEAQDLLAKPVAIRLAEFGGTQAEARDVIHNLSLCAFADGILAESEKRMLTRIGQSLGLNEEQVFSILEGEQTAMGTVVLDTDAAKKFLASRPKMPQHTACVPGISPDTVARVRERLSVAEDEDVMLIYENRFLDKTVECAALTGSKLYLRTPRGTQHAVQLRLVEGCKLGSMWADLLLTDRKNIRMSRTAEPFLTLVTNCVKENLKVM